MIIHLKGLKQISSDEVSPLLSDDEASQSHSITRKVAAISVEGMSPGRVAIAIGFTWFGSFLAALGKLCIGFCRM